MFAEPTPAGDTAAALIPWWGWAALAVTALAAAWWLMNRYGLPDFGPAAQRLRRLLIKRRTASPAPPSPEAPRTQEEAPAASKADTPASPGEAGAPPAPERTASTDEAPPWLMKALVAIAAVPTLLALPLAAWSVAQVLPVPLPVALPIGVLFDVAMVASVLIALLAPRFVRPATQVGWITAALAAAAIVAHAGLSVASLFAAAPIVSKLLWGMVVQIRTEQAHTRRREAARLAEEARVEAQRLQKEAQEEAAREADLSVDLEHERLAEIAQLERDALYEEKVAAAKLKVKEAKSKAEHLEALAEIARIGEQKRAEDDEAAKVWAQQIRLNHKLQAMRGDMPSFLAVEPGVADAELVPEVTASTGTTQAGFGSGFGFSRPLDVKALTPEGASVSFEELPSTHQQLVRYVRSEKAPTVRGAARRLDRDARTIRRWKDKLSEFGYDLPIGE